MRSKNITGDQHFFITKCKLTALAEIEFSGRPVEMAQGSWVDFFLESARW
jgi:hypothetical protein